jgi:thymidylate kinase
MEQEPLKFYEAVCAAYRELAEREPHRICLVDGTRSVGEIEEEIWHTIARRFPQLAALLRHPMTQKGA